VTTRMLGTYIFKYNLRPLQRLVNSISPLGDQRTNIQKRLHIRRNRLRGAKHRAQRQCINATLISDPRFGIQSARERGRGRVSDQIGHVDSESIHKVRNRLWEGGVWWENDVVGAGGGGGSGDEVADVVDEACEDPV
jgi:hypothetical protein